MNDTAKSFSIVTGFSIATRLLSFIFKIWMSRALGATVVGRYQIAMSVMTLLFTLTAGAPTVLSRKVAEADARGDYRAQNSLLTASVLLGLTISITLAGVLFVLRSKLGFLFSDPKCLPIFIIMLPTLITSTLYASLRSWFWGRKKFLAFSSTEFLDEVVKILLSAIFAGGVISAMDEAEGVALAMTLSDAVCAVALGVMFFIAGGRFCKPKGFKELTVRTIPLSATRILTSLTASLTAVVIPKMLIDFGMAPDAATAEYGRVAGMALPLIMAPLMFVSSLSVVLIPDIAALKAKGQLDAVRKKLNGAMIFATITASLFFALYLPLGGELGKLFFGDAKAGEFVSHCSALLFPIAIANVTAPALNSLGKERATFLTSLAGSATMLPCMFLLPKYIGVYSMAVGSGLCFSVMAIINCLLLKKETGGFVDVKKVVKTLCFALPLALIGYFSKNILTPVAGGLTSTLVIGVFEIFFMFISINAFNIADIMGYIRLFKPSSAGVFKLKKRDARNGFNHAKKRARRSYRKRRAAPAIF